MMLHTVTVIENHCRRGDVRLVDGTTNRDGRVEVCIDRQWETVCSEDRQTDEVAGVVCTQLGFPRTGNNTQE